jgi:murein DD-endopeptidase MepM/ murein hydrolase activator NlpD
MHMHTSISLTTLLQTIFTAAVIDGPGWAAELGDEETLAQVSKEQIAGKRFKFYWHSDEGNGFNGVATLLPDGVIQGIRSPNESTWTIDDNGCLVFKHLDGRVSTRYRKTMKVEGILFFEGPFKFRHGITHRLIQVAAPVVELSRCITPEESARISYSNQQFVYLDENEEHAFRTRDGSMKTIRLVSVREHSDSVIGLMRSADVNINVEGKQVRLRCVPYAMPTEAQGLKILVDTTSACLQIPKRVQLSVWDAGDPIVDTDRFCFPLPDYHLFGLGTQAYNEPVHLGHLDGDPAGQMFYHNYGVDLAGLEGRQKVVSCISGVVVRVEPETGTLCIRDDRGFILVYGHLDSVLSDVQVGATVQRGQWIGMLGKRGSAGNFSHLHIGAYLSEAAMLVDRMDRNLNLFPWLVAAYQASTGASLIAIARPHQIARVNESIVLDGSSTVNDSPHQISYRWEFDDGSCSEGAVAKKAFAEPGCYIATLQVRREDGASDFDFCRIRVFSDPPTEPFIPTLFVSTKPAGVVRQGQPVSFRIWPQGGNVDPIRLDFGDGSPSGNYRAYSSFTHYFMTPGPHTVTASGRYKGMPIRQKRKILVRE